MYHKPTERVLSIFTYLANQKNGATLTDLAASLDIPKSTISPILQEMAYQNYLYLDESSNKYHIGITTQAIASTYDPIQEIYPLIQKEMKKITEKTAEICQLGILEGENVLYISKEEPKINLDIQIISHVGTRIPAYCTALGKALLMGSSLTQLENLYPQGLHSKTSKTITDMVLLKKQLDSFQDVGISNEEEEITPYLCCYAVPINLPNNQKIAISVSMPIFRADESKRKLVKKLLLQAKKNIDTQSV